jgi:membrane protease YdiL (CAAX protease family)
MLLHLSPARFPHTLAIGLAAGFLRVRSKSILPCMALHFSHNFLCVALEWSAR